MYPVLRMAKELFVHRNAARLPVTGTHVSHHICWPWDLDFWMELNNGRTLTLYDLGRIPLSKRTGFVDVLRANDWGMTVAGVSARYRRRVRVFDRVTMKSRVICADGRFFYLEQSMWRPDGSCTSHVLYRMAITGPDGIVPPSAAFELMGIDRLPDMPGWVAAWTRADAERPWPPMQDATQE